MMYKMLLNGAAIFAFALPLVFGLAGGSNAKDSRSIENIIKDRNRHNENAEAEQGVAANDSVRRRNLERDIEQREKDIEQQEGKIKKEKAEIAMLRRAREAQLRHADRETRHLREDDAALGRP